MSEDIAVYRPTPIELTRTTTDDWFEAFANIVKLAEYVSDTEFVPDAMRRKPAAVAAAILTGREMGLPPMVALRHLYVIKGRVGQSAELMRAQVYRAGHEIRYIESTDQRCVVEGRRSSESDWTRVQFTADDAKHAGIDLRGYAADKLLARATSRLARRKFPDSVMGLPTIDELEDTSDTAAVVELAPTAEGPAVQRKRQPRKPRAAATQPPAAPPGARVAAPNDDDLLDDEPDLPAAQANLQAAEILATEITTTDDDVAALTIPDEPDPPITDDQLKLLWIRLRENDLQDRDTALAWITAALDVPVISTKDLTRRQATKVIDLLGPQPDQQDLLDQLDDNPGN